MKVHLRLDERREERKVKVGAGRSGVLLKADVALGSAALSLLRCIVPIIPVKSTSDPIRT